MSDRGKLALVTNYLSVVAQYCCEALLTRGSRCRLCKSLLRCVAHSCAVGLRELLLTSFSLHTRYFFMHGVLRHSVAFVGGYSLLCVLGVVLEFDKVP
jgi:hypothetical protein